MQHKVMAQIGANSISIETGKIAKLADGSVVVSCGETMVFVSAVSATAVKEGQDYFPLMVDYREKAAAAGKFPGGYFKREGRPTEKETLTSRMIDRPLRPLFPQGYFYDTQIISILLSADGEQTKTGCRVAPGESGTARYRLSRCGRPHRTGALHRRQGCAR